MMLIEEMVLSFVIDHTIGIVHPHGIWTEMELRAVWFRVFGPHVLLV
jgi:hypothetical protein